MSGLSLRFLWLRDWFCLWRSSFSSVLFDWRWAICTGFGRHLRCSLHGVSSLKLNPRERLQDGRLMHTTVRHTRQSRWHLRRVDVRINAVWTLESTLHHCKWSWRIEGIGCAYATLMKFSNTSQESLARDSDVHCVSRSGICCHHPAHRLRGNKASQRSFELFDTRKAGPEPFDHDAGSSPQTGAGSRGAAGLQHMGSS